MLEQIRPIRLTKKDAAKALGISVDGLNKIMAKDKFFPKCYKTGTSRQAHVFFDYADLVAWHQQQKDSAA